MFKVACKFIFEDFITHARTNRCNIMCSLVAHDQKLPSSEFEESSIGDMLIPKHVIIEALKALVANLNYIEIWIKLLE